MHLGSLLLKNVSRITLSLKNLVFRDHKDKNGILFSYPLIVATRLGQLDSVKYLLEHGAQVNLQDSDGKTALHHAAYGGHSNVMKELLDSKADMIARNEDGYTPLHLAAYDGHLNAVKTCLRYG